MASPFRTASARRRRIAPPLTILTTVLFILGGGQAHALAASDGGRRIGARWTDLSAGGGDRDGVAPPSPPRSGHAAFYAGDGSLRIFGGYAEEKGDGGGGGGGPVRYPTADMFEWSGVDGGGWAKVDQGGEVPGPRLASAAASVGGRPVLFGGWDPQTPGTGGIILDTVHELDPTTNTWRTLDVTVPDGPTSRHVALTLPGGNEALIHNHRCTDHVLIFDGEDFRRQPTTGEAPSSRGLHAAAMAGTRAVMFGGAAQDGQMSNEVFVLDTETWRWDRIEIEGDGPSPRAGACLCGLGDDCVLLFGGAEQSEAGLNPRGDVWALTLDAATAKGRWELLLDDDDDGAGGPPPRNAATLSEIEPPEGAFDGLREGETKKCFLLQGGWAPFRKTWSDCYILGVCAN